MTVFVVSDTHRSFLFAPFLEIVQAQKPDMVIHCGDGVCDAEDIAALHICPVVSVAGNCDAPGARERTVQAEGHTILVTHGHLFGAESSSERLKEEARAQNADIVCYGHTHTPDLTFSGGIWLINPGSLCRPRDDFSATYCRLSITRESIVPTLVPF
ncbi:MAG: metallophosphoesterase [Clostridia bacterium]|nr:metallophosphoesterase [Clostridia bacterium]